MTINHHVSEDLLLSYAAGSLAEGWGIAVATHLALCPSCRRNLAAAERIGGRLFTELSCDALETSSWTEGRRRLNEQVHSALPRMQPVPQEAPSVMVPEPLRSYVGDDFDSLKWRALGLGAYEVRIPTSDNETTVRLLRIPIGKPVPEHSHGGRELTLVLSGYFVDGDMKFARGDMEDADATVTHTPVAGSDSDCICLAVTDLPLKFSSWFMRAIQPILKI